MLGSEGPGAKGGRPSPSRANTSPVQAASAPGMEEVAPQVSCGPTNLVRLAGIDRISGLPTVTNPPFSTRSHATYIPTGTETLNRQRR